MSTAAPVLSTVDGTVLDLQRLKPEDIRLEVIAHNLSCLVRWAGQTTQPLTVAEHSVHMARAAKPCHAAEALLHDAAEGYCGDVIRPVKRHPGMRWYVRLEEKIDAAIRERFGLPPEMTRAVARLDNQMLRTEIDQLLPPGRYEFAPRVKPLPVLIECWSFRRSEREFLRTARELGIT